MASSRGCAPAGASSLWLHTASRRRPSLRQAPGAVADHPRPRGHPALLPSAPPRQGPGLEAALLPRKGACHEAAPHVSGRPDGVPQRRAQKRPVARGAPQPACSAACVRGARVSPWAPACLGPHFRAPRQSPHLGGPAAAAAGPCRSLARAHRVPAQASPSGQRALPRPRPPGSPCPSWSPWDPQSSPGDLWCLRILPGTQEGTGPGLQTPAEGPRLSLPHPSPARGPCALTPRFGLGREWRAEGEKQVPAAGGPWRPS